MSRKPFLTKLHLQNFKSFRSETVEFENPLFLVGKNDSGKTNFLNAISFLADCMRSPLSTVVEKLGGFTQLSNTHMIGLEASAPYEAPVHLRADFGMEEGQSGHYAFELGFVPGSANSYDVIREQCHFIDPSGKSIWFDRDSDGFRTNVAGLDVLGFSWDTQALAMPIVGGVQVFAPIVKALGAMRVYAIEPEAIRRSQEQKSNGYLNRDGSNIIDVLQSLAKRNPNLLTRLQELLTPVSPNLTELMLVSGYGERTTLRFTQKASHNANIVFHASSMADGTLRALGLLVAAMQEPVPTLLAFDEPELYLHLGALGTISDLIQSAAEQTQVVLTTHSPDLIDEKWVAPQYLRVVQRLDGVTHVLPLGPAPVLALQKHLMGAGELLRANALDAAPEVAGATDQNLYDLMPA